MKLWQPRSFQRFIEKLLHLLCRQFVCCHLLACLTVKFKDLNLGFVGKCAIITSLIFLADCSIALLSFLECHGMFGSEIQGFEPGICKKITGLQH
jgi:hypothetical protein